MASIYPAEKVELSNEQVRERWGITVDGGGWFEDKDGEFLFLMGFPMPYAWKKDGLFVGVAKWAEARADCIAAW